MRDWHEKNIVAFTGESTHGAGGISIAWYLASRLFWKPEEDMDNLLDDFFRDAPEAMLVPQAGGLQALLGEAVEFHDLGCTDRETHGFLQPRACRSRLSVHTRRAERTGFEQPAQTSGKPTFYHQALQNPVQLAKQSTQSTPIYR